MKVSNRNQPLQLFDGDDSRNNALRAVVKTLACERENLVDALALFDIPCTTSTSFEPVVQVFDKDAMFQGYPVQVNLFPKPVIKSIEGPVMCWPVD